MRMRKKAAVFSLWVCSCFLMSGGVCHAQTRIDLEVESIQIQPSRPGAKQAIEATASIRNNGSEPADNIYLALEIKTGGKRVKLIDNIPALSRLPRLGSGLSLPVSVGGLPAGSYEMLAMVDRDDIIHETNEANNQKTISFQVAN